MIAQLALFLVAMAVSATPVQAQTSGIVEASAIEMNFAPPIGTVLRYEELRTSEREGQLYGARLTHDFSFERIEDGYLVWAELVDIEGLGDERSARMVEAIAEPMLNLRYAIALSAYGEPVAVRDEERIWRQMLAGMDRIDAATRERTDINERERVQLLGLISALRTQDTEDRQTSHLLVISEILALADRTVEVGEHPHSGELAIAGMPRLEANGTIAAGFAGEDMAHVDTETAAIVPDHYAIREQLRYSAAPSSGLVHHMERIRHFDAQSEAAHSYVDRVEIRLLGEAEAAENAADNAF